MVLDSIGVFHLQVIYTIASLIDTLIKGRFRVNFTLSKCNSFYAYHKYQENEKTAKFLYRLHHESDHDRMVERVYAPDQ
jgi:hypothetical protein